MREEERVKSRKITFDKKLVKQFFEEYQQNQEVDFQNNISERINQIWMTKNQR